MDELRIRLVKEDDLESIARISNWAILNTVANFGVEAGTVDQWRADWGARRGKYPWLVAEFIHDSVVPGSPTPQASVSTHEVVGFAMASEFKGRCAYEYTAEVSVYIDPAHHGKGIGTRVYETLLALLDAQSYRNLIAVIALPNPASVRLHESFGFAKAGELGRVGWKFDRWHDVGYWQRAVDGDAPPIPIKTVEEIVEP